MNVLIKPILVRLHKFSINQLMQSLFDKIIGFSIIRTNFVFLTLMSL